MPNELQSCLRQLRWNLRLWFLAYGISRVLLCGLVLAVVDCGLDWLLHMDRGQRLVVLGLAGTVLLAVLGRCLLRPLLAQPADDAICLEVERQNPELGGVLISAWQLGHSASAGTSAAMVQRVLEQSNDALRELRPGAIVDRAALRTNVLLLLALTTLLASAVAASPRVPALQIWYRRNVMLDEVPWPQDTWLTLPGVADGRLKLSRGATWVQPAHIDETSEVVPDELLVEFGDSREPVRMHRVGPHDFRASFRDVQDDFHFRVTGGDAVSPWVAVEVIPPPVIESMELHVSPPDYTGNPVVTHRAVIGAIPVLPGSRIRIDATANKPLGSVRLLPVNRRCVAVDRRVRVEIGADEVVAGRWTLTFADDDGLTGETHFDLALAEDLPPVVAAVADRAGASISTRALISLSAVIEDDFGIGDTRVRWIVRRDGKLRGDVLPRGRSPAAVGGTTGMEKTMTLEKTIDTASFRIEPGDSLGVTVEADDRKSPGAPNTGQSDELVFQVVSDEQLRSELLRQEKEQGQLLEDLIRQQEELLLETRATDPESVQARALVEFARRQKVIGANVDSVANRFREIAAEMVSNRLETADSRFSRRLADDIIRPLERLVAGELDTTHRQLEQVRTLLTRGRGVARPLDEVVASQREVVDAMRHVLANVEAAQGFQEAVNLLLELQKAQQDVYQRTRQERQRQIQRLLKSQPKTNESG